MVMKDKVKKTGLVLVIFVAMAGLLFFAGRPIFIGYSTYKAVTAENYTIEEYNQIATEGALQIQNLSNELNASNQKILDLQNQTNQLGQQISDAEQQREEDKKQNALELQEANDEISALSNKIKQKDAQISDMQKSYESLGFNTAKSICCKMKLDNPDIDYYSIKNDKIVCSTEGKAMLKCSFS